MLTTKNIKYGVPKRCLLDVYHRKRSTNATVVIAIHGGSWFLGSKDIAEEMSSVLVRKGCVVVTPSYRLTTFSNQNIKTLMFFESILLLILAFFSRANQRGIIIILLTFFTLLIISYAISKPRQIIQHPTHANDVAEVVSWTVNNIEKFGGNKKRIFILGHSAGAHLASLVSLNPIYLQRVNLPLSTIKGCISISGVFSDKRMKQSRLGKEILKNAFGYHSTYINAFPIYHIQPTSIPHLLLNANIDYTLKRHTLDMMMSFREQGVYAKSKVYPNTNHFNIRHRWEDQNKAVLQDIMQFIYEVLE